MGTSKSKDKIYCDSPNYGSVIIVNNPNAYNPNNLNHLNDLNMMLCNDISQNNWEYIESQVKETDYKKDKNYKKYIKNLQK